MALYVLQENGHSKFILQLLRKFDFFFRLILFFEPHHLVTFNVDYIKNSSILFEKGFYLVTVTNGFQ